MTAIKLCAVFLFALYFSRHSSELAFLFVVACLVLHLFWRVFIFVARPFFLGFFAAWGVRRSGVLSRLQRPRRARVQRDPNDDFPENLSD
jgi:hypothetical protein